MTNVKGPIISFADLPSIEAYLSAHEGSQSGFWLKLAKAGAPEATITKAQAIEAALCHGWIDGQLAKFDEHYFLVRMTPRRSAADGPQSIGYSERLIREAHAAARAERGPRPWPMVAGARRINPRAKPNLRPISWLRWLQMRKQNGRLRRSTVPTGTPSSIA